MTKDRLEELQSLVTENEKEELEFLMKNALIKQVFLKKSYTTFSLEYDFVHVHTHVHAC